MSTDDDRPTPPGGFPRTHSAGGEEYSGAHRASEPSYGGASQYDDSGYDTSGYSSSSTTTALSTPDQDDRVAAPPRHQWHGGLDIGLLVLRLALGGAFIAHGLQKLFGLFNGPGIDGFAQFLGSAGFSQTTLLAWVTGISETGGGVLLVLGLFTPAGAAAVLGVMANAIYLKWSGGYFAPRGFEYDLMLAATAFALLFTGPGRVAIDRNTPWARKPIPFGVGALVLAAGLSVVTLVVLR